MTQITKYTTTQLKNKLNTLQLQKLFNTYITFKEAEFLNQLELYTPRLK